MRPVPQKFVYRIRNSSLAPLATHLSHVAGDLGPAQVRLAWISSDRLVWKKEERMGASSSSPLSETEASLMPLRGMW